MSHSIAIVTPLYKEKPSDSELASLRHSFGVLANRKKFIVAPNDLDLSGYEDVLNGCEIIRLDAKYFKSVAAYNRLMLSKYFYRLFVAFDFMLLLQPDAIVLRDELDSWCERGYDYIGAPWPKGWDIPPFYFRYYSLTYRCLPWFNKPIRKYVGNGGLSMRKISSALEALDKHWMAARIWGRNEDLFWSLYSQNVPGVKEASMFALEREPSFYYRANGNLLPVGCHAWEKYEPEFWQEQFQLEGCVQLSRIKAVKQ